MSSTSSPTHSTHSTLSHPAPPMQEPIIPLPQGLLFGVKPSSLLKSPIINCAKQRSPGFQQDNRLRLVAEEFRIKRLQELHLIILRRVSSEEEHLKKQQQELLTLLYAEEQGSGCNGLDPQVALALARATRDALMAEEEAAKLRILECEQLLETLKDAADDAHARVEDAHSQIGQILSIFERQEIQVDLSKQNFVPSHPSRQFTDWSIVHPPVPSQAKPWAHSHSPRDSVSSSSCSRSATDSDGDSGNEPPDGPCDPF